MNNSNINQIKKCLIITNTNAIPFHHIFSDIPKENLYLIANQTSFSEEEITNLSANYKEIRVIKNYYYSGEVELAAIELHEKYKFDSIVAPAEDDVLRAAKLRDYLKIQGQGYKSALVFRDKLLMKDTVKNVVKVPKYAVLDSPLDLLDFINKNGFPVVAKPARSRGAYGVYVLKNNIDVQNFLKISQLFNSSYQSFYEIEEFIEGTMYQLDGLVKDGKIIAMWPSKFVGNCVDFLKGKIFECRLLSATDLLIPRFKYFAEKVIAAMPTPNTAFHLEVFHTNNDEIVFCEIASRAGGPRLREIWLDGFNIDIGTTFIRMQAGLETPGEPTGNPMNPKSICGFMMIPSQSGTLQSLDLTCPYQWVTYYYPNKEKIGKSLTLSKEYGDTIASLAFVAPTEDEYKERSKMIVDWLSNSIRWA